MIRTKFAQAVSTLCELSLGDALCISANVGVDVPQLTLDLATILRDGTGDAHSLDTKLDQLIGLI